MYGWFNVYENLVIVGHNNKTTFFNQNIYKCPNNRSEYAVYMHSYNWRNISTKVSISKERLWTSYEILRELCVKILPFLGVVVSKLILIKRGSKIAALILKNYSNYSEKNEITVPTVHDISTQKSSGKSLGPRINSSAIVYHQSEANKKSWYDRKVEENKQHVRTGFILTIEFVVFMLPLAIIEILKEIVVVNAVTMSMVYVLLSLLEFVYVTCTFFINLAFNRLYRKYFYQCVKGIYSRHKLFWR
ncbi:unnamed protein product [Gordionus sp. m RMFG-2023]